MAKKIESKKSSMRNVDFLTDQIVPAWKKSFVYVKKTEVATWKGALVLTFITGIAVAVIWTAKIGYHESSSAAAESTIYFNPVTYTATAGESFNMNAVLNPGTNRVSAADIRITYDQTKLTLNSITCSSPFGNTLTAASIPGDGTARIVCGESPIGTHVTTTSTVAVFAFTGLSAVSNSLIEFTDKTAASAIGETGDVIISRTGATVTLNAADTTAPTGGSITYSNGYATAASVSITAADGTDGESGINTSSRAVQRRSATFSAGTCGSYGSWSTIAPTGSYPNFTDTSVTTGNCYQYQYLVSDSAPVPNRATYTSANVVRVDTAAPASGSVTYTDGYFKTASVAVTAADGTDSASGLNTSSRIVQRRAATLSSGTCGSYGSWSAITPTGTYPNFTDTTVASGNCYQYRYLISDVATNQATYPSGSTARIDSGAPSGGSITYTSGYFKTASVALTAADGSDSVSGISTASRTVQRRSATLSGGTCGSYGSFSNVTVSGTYPNFADTSVTTGNCYQYQYLVSDAATNQSTYTSTNVARVDTAAPTGGSVAYSNGYINTTSASVTAADGSDSVSGINTSSRAVQRRVATLSSGTCGTYGSWAAATLTGSYPNFTDAGLAIGNCYQYQYIVSDTATNQAAYTSTNAIRVTYPADVTLNGAVDSGDFTLLRTNFGNTTCGDPADIIADCVVDIFDFNQLVTDFGSHV